MGLTHPPPSPNTLSGLQLQRELATAAHSATRGGHAPILTHLNTDTSSWLLQLPHPSSSSSSVGAEGRIYYNILLDPWLRSGAWFSHAAPRGSLAEVEALVREREEDVWVARVGQRGSGRAKGAIDAVVVSHGFTDRCCQRETLLQVRRDVPVFAPRKAAEIIRSWRHFRTVEEIPVVVGGDRVHDSLPYWIGIDRLTPRASNGVDLHSAILITFGSDDDAAGGGGSARRHEEQEDEPKRRGIVYTPHGIDLDQIIPETKPRVDILALLYGLHDITIGGWGRAQLNLGGHNGLKTQRLLKAKYWVGTHDEVKKSGGIIGYLLRRKVVTVKEALEKELERRRQQLDDDNDDGSEVDMINMARVIRFVELGNGESIALE